MGKDKPAFLVETEDQLLIPQYTYMSEEKFKGLTESKKEEARKVILRIISHEENFNSFLESPGWLVKLAVHPSIALKGLNEAYYGELKQKDERYPALLIGRIMEDKEAFEKLLSMYHVSFSRLVSSLQGNNGSRIERNLEGLIQHHMPYIENAKEKEIPVLNVVYWKALGLLGELNSEKAASIKTNAQEIIERFLKEDFVIPLNFYLFFHGLSKYEKKLFSSHYRFVGERLHYFHPSKALQVIKISTLAGNIEGFITLGLYHQHMGDYKEAIKYFTSLKDATHILCNLGAAYEDLEQKEKAIECYQKLKPESLTGKYRLLRLYESMEEKEKALATQTHIMSTLKQLEESLRCYNPIEAAVISLLLGKPQAAKKFMGFSRSDIDKTNFSPHKGELYILSAFVKYGIKQHDPSTTFAESEDSHLAQIKKWVHAILERTGRGNPGGFTPFTQFSLMTGCIGSYSLGYLTQTPVEQILADFDKYIPQHIQVHGTKE